MEQTLLIVLMEVLLAAAIALIVLLVLGWRKKMRCQAALERLLEDLQDRQALRNERIMGHLIQQYQFDECVAQDLSAALFVAEKLFLSQFIEQQMQQQSVEGFYQNLCELLDSYLYMIPAKAVNNSQSCLSAPLPASGNASPEEMRRKERNVGNTSLPDWGDVFD